MFIMLSTFVIVVKIWWVSERRSVRIPYMRHHWDNEPVTTETSVDTPRAGLLKWFNESYNTLTQLSAVLIVIPFLASAEWNWSRVREVIKHCYTTWQLPYTTVYVFITSDIWSVETLKLSRVSCWQVGIRPLAAGTGLSLSQSEDAGSLSWSVRYYCGRPAPASQLQLTIELQILCRNCSEHLQYVGSDMCLL